MEPSAACGEAFLLPNIAYINGPSVPADTPEIPTHIKSPKNSGGRKTNNEANIPTTRTAYLLIFRAILSTLSSFTFMILRLTKTLRKMSFAKTVDMTTNNPSVVDKAAAKITTAIKAARNAGSPQVIYSIKARSATSIFGRAALAYNPPNKTNRLVTEAIIYTIIIFLKSFCFSSERTLLNNCGWAAKANCTIISPTTAETA